MCLSAVSSGRVTPRHLHDWPLALDPMNGGPITAKLRVGRMNELHLQFHLQFPSRTGWRCDETCRVGQICDQTLLAVVVDGFPHSDCDVPEQHGFR